MVGIPQIEKIKEEQIEAIKLYILRQAETLYGFPKEELGIATVLDLIPVRGEIYHWTIAAILPADGYLRVCTITQSERFADTIPTEEEARLTNNNYLPDKSNEKIWKFDSPVPASELSFNPQTNKLELEVDTHTYVEAIGRSYRAPVDDD